MSVRSLLFALAIFFATAWAPRSWAGAAAPCPAILNHQFANLMDEPVSLCQWSGRVLLVVNTASLCGYTPQYEGLEKLHRRYRDRGFTVLAFPANDFGAQEPGSNKEIAQFCQVNYDISFPIFAKSSVIGVHANPFFRELARNSGQAPRWNFHKYLLDRNGRLVGHFASAVEPEDQRLTTQIEKLLAAR